MPIFRKMSVYGHKETIVASGTWSFQAQYGYILAVEWLYDVVKPNNNLQCENNFAPIFHCHMGPGPLDLHMHLHVQYGCQSG